jgi:hypothetical protein
MLCTYFEGVGSLKTHLIFLEKLQPLAPWMIPIPKKLLAM